MLRLFFRLPWQVFLLLSGFVIWVGFTQYQSEVSVQAERAEALAGRPPSVVPLRDFDPEVDVHLAGEVNIVGQIDPQYNYRLTEERRGTDDVRRLFVLFDSTDRLGYPQARAAIMIDDEQMPAFMEWVDEVSKTFGPAGPVISVNGLHETRPALAGMAREAMSEEGLTLAENFVFVTPFLEGRAAGLAPSSFEPWNKAGGLWGIGAIFGVTAMVKRARRKPKGAAQPVGLDTGSVRPQRPQFQAQGDRTPRPAALLPRAAQSSATAVGQTAPSMEPVIQSPDGIASKVRGFFGSGKSAQGRPDPFERLARQTAER